MPLYLVDYLSGRLFIYPISKSGRLQLSHQPSFLLAHRGSNKEALDGGLDMHHSVEGSNGMLWDLTIGQRPPHGSPAGSKQRQTKANDFDLKCAEGGGGADKSMCRIST